MIIGATNEGVLVVTTHDVNAKIDDANLDSELQKIALPSTRALQARSCLLQRGQMNIFKADFG